MGVLASTECSGSCVHPRGDARLGKSSSRGCAVTTEFSVTATRCIRSALYHFPYSRTAISTKEGTASCFFSLEEQERPYAKESAKEVCDEQAQEAFQSARIQAISRHDFVVSGQTVAAHATCCRRGRGCVCEDRTIGGPQQQRRSDQAQEQDGQEGVVASQESFFIFWITTT
jgi:hypothetical protein